MEAIKETHRREVDRMMREMKAETEENEREAEEARGRYIQEVRRREAAHKELVEGVRLEHDQRAEEAKRLSDETLHQQKKALKGDFITARDSRLKAAISDLSTKKLTASKALETDFQPSLAQAKAELRQLTAEVQARPPLLLSLTPSPLLYDSCTNTEQEEAAGETAAQSAFADLAGMLNGQCEELEGRVKEVVSEVEGRQIALEARYREIEAECRLYEEAIADLVGQEDTL